VNFGGLTSVLVFPQVLSDGIPDIPSVQKVEKLDTSLYILFFFLNPIYVFWGHALCKMRHTAILSFYACSVDAIFFRRRGGLRNMLADI
jgi:hypothetical protein